MPSVCRNSLIFSIAGLLIAGSAVEGKEKKKKAPGGGAQDSIEVAAHIPAANRVVKSFRPTQHYSSQYLYVEYADARNVTLLDVTNPDRPSVLGDVAYPSNNGGSDITAVAGTAVLVGEQGSGAPSGQNPKAFRIMDFSNPQQPRVVREFTGVTTLSSDESRGLIFLANGEGIWVLRKSFALDPEVKKEYERRILYDR